MAQTGYAFYIRDPSITPEDLKAALEEGYPTFKAYYRSEIIRIGAPNKGGAYIQLDRSPVTGVKVSLDTDNIVTVLPNMGSGCLGFLLGFLEFLFQDWKLAREVGGFLRERFGETELLVCRNHRIPRVFPHYVKACPLCGGPLSPYDEASGEASIPGRGETEEQATRASAAPSVAGQPSRASSPGAAVARRQPEAMPAAKRGRSRRSAILLEIVPGLAGLFGFGWIYAGNTKVGVSLLVAGVIWWIISLIAGGLTGSISCFITVPISLAVVAVSSLALSNYAKRHPELLD